MSKRDNGRDLLIKLLEHRELDEVLGSLKKEVKKDDKPKKWYHNTLTVYAIMILSWPIVGPLFALLQYLSQYALVKILTQH